MEHLQTLIDMGFLKTDVLVLKEKQAIVIIFETLNSTENSLFK